jgi:glycosyltransferase involved in cell wall biosynthesis
MPYNVTHYGNYAPNAGGISSVLREYMSWTWTDARLQVVDTYATSKRLWGASAFLRAARHVLTHPRHEIGIAHVHLSQRGSFLREGTLLRLARARRLPCMVTLHGSGLQSFTRDHPRLVASTLRCADTVVVLYAQQAAALAALVEGVRVVVIPNAVAADGDVRPPDECPPVALFAGEVGPRKGVDVLLKTWAQLRATADAELWVAGPVAEPGVLESMPDRVRVLGPLARSEVRRRLGECRVAVLPSRAEAFPVFILEAMAAGRPVVACDVAGVRDMVGDCGAVVPVGDVQALAGALAQYLGDPARAARDGAAATRRVLECFTPDVVVSALEREWRLLLKGRGAPQMLPNPASGSAP